MTNGFDATLVAKTDDISTVILPRPSNSITDPDAVEIIRENDGFAGRAFCIEINHGSKRRRLAGGSKRPCANSISDSAIDSQSDIFVYMN